jgi:hypothetical protein
MESIEGLVYLLTFLGVLGVTHVSWRRFGKGNPNPSSRPRSAILIVLGLSLSFACMGVAAADVLLWEWKKAGGFDGRPPEKTMSMELMSSGQTAPDFSLPSLHDGRSVRLGDFRGHKPVLLIFGSFG